MDNWTKMLLGQSGAAAFALEEIERQNRLTRTAASTALGTTLAEEYRRATLLDYDLERAAGIQAGMKHLMNFPDDTRLDRFSTASDFFRVQAANQGYLANYSPLAIDEARSIAEFAQTRILHASLDPFRTSIEPFVGKLLHLQTLETIRPPAYLDAFIQTSTVSDMFNESLRVDSQLQAAIRQFALVSVPEFGILDDYRRFLDAAGLRLSHWPHVRLLTIGEKRRRFRNRLSSNTEPVHAKRARTLVQRYEVTLRDVLNDAMTSEYGDDWAMERLPLCNCKDLLGKWQKRGGEVLNHADYFHYAYIMSYPEHFNAVFAVGFDDPTTLAELIKRAGNLRAALQHFHPFTPKDVRDLRLVWRTIETGLLALTADYDISSWN